MRKIRRTPALAPSLIAAITALLALLLLTASIACGSSGHAIVYLSEVDGQAEIHVIAPASGDSAPAAPTVIASRPSPAGAGSGPRWSPDGNRIAFASGEPGNLDIMIADANGEGEPVRVTTSAGNEQSPRWSADGDRVAYTTDADGHSDIYLSWLQSDAAAPSAPVRITSSDTDESLGDWSPDGQWLVFTRADNGAPQGLWLRNPDGVNLLQITNGHDSAPVWSPDNDAIAFVREVDGNRDIYLLRPQQDQDWRGLLDAEALIDSPHADHSPAWAPDGDTLAFVSDRDGNPEIYVFDTDEDGPPQRLTVNESADSQPVWSPDGAQIAFVSNLHEQSEIYAMNHDGANQRRLTHNQAIDHSPDW